MERLSTLARGRGKVPTCGHPELPYYCRDMCKNCYSKWRYKNVPGVAASRRASSVKWEKANPHKLREKVWRRHKIDITYEEYERLLEKQQSVCAICLGEDKQLVVDHDHSTGLVRGLLCRNCNYYLGWYEAHGPRVSGYLGESL
jgi:hypothetical protein